MVLGPDGMPKPPTYAFNTVSVHDWGTVCIVGQLLKCRRQILRIFQTIHVVPITIIKLGILFFYRRIFRGSTFLGITWATIFLVITWGVGFFFSTLFECTPIRLSLVAPPGTPGLHCIDQTANFWALSISDVIIDLIILAIPFPFVWNLQMSVQHKISVSGMFFLGVL